MILATRRSEWQSSTRADWRLEFDRLIPGPVSRNRQVATPGRLSRLCYAMRLCGDPCFQSIDHVPSQAKHAAPTGKGLILHTSLIAQSIEPILRAQRRRALAYLDDCAVWCEPYMNHDTGGFHVSLPKLYKPEPKPNSSTLISSVPSTFA